MFSSVVYTCDIYIYKGDINEKLICNEWINQEFEQKLLSESMHGFKTIQTFFLISKRNDNCNTIYINIYRWRWNMSGYTSLSMFVCVYSVW